mgnify:CR=1 FL=1
MRALEPRDRRDVNARGDARHGVSTVDVRGRCQGTVVYQSDKVAPTRENKKPKLQARTHLGITLPSRLVVPPSGATRVCSSAMAKNEKGKKKGDDEGGGEPEAVKLTAVTALLPDPNDVKHNVQLLVEQLKKAPSNSAPRARSDAALFLWDLVLNDPEAKARLQTMIDEFAANCVVALRDGDIGDRSAVVSLLAEACVWSNELKLLLASAANLVERLCDILDDRYDAGALTGKNANPHSSNGDNDTLVAKSAASFILKELTTTNELRQLVLPAPKKGKGLRLKMDVLVDCVRVNAHTNPQTSERPELWQIRTNCLHTLHQCMDPNRNKDAKRARSDAFGDGDNASDSKIKSTATPSLTLRAFSHILGDQNAPNEARRNAAWCLAHLSHDEKRREAVLGDKNVTTAIKHTLRKEKNKSKSGKTLLDFPIRAGVAACVSNLCAVDDDGEGDGSHFTDNDASIASLRAQANTLEGRFSVLKKIPKDELKPADAEEKTEIGKELKGILKILNGELLAPSGEVGKRNAHVTKIRAELVLRTTRALGPLCRLLTPPGEVEGDESESEAEEPLSDDAKENEEFQNQSDREDASVPGSPGGVTGEGTDETTDNTIETEGETPGGETGDATAGEAKEGEGLPSDSGEVATDAVDGVVADLTGEPFNPAEVTEPKETDPEEPKTEETKKAHALLLGQAEAVSHAAAALRRLTLDGDGEIAKTIHSKNAHAHLLWHLNHTKDVSTKRNARETLRQLSFSQEVRDAIVAVPDAPTLVSRVFAVDTKASSTILDSKNLQRLNKLLPGLHANSHRRRPADEIKATRVEAYRVFGSGGKDD